MGEKVSATIVIPTFHPGHDLTVLLHRLSCQTVLPSRILIVNTCEKPEDASQIRTLIEQATARPDWCQVPVNLIQIPKEQFDHGGTRDMAARMTYTDWIVFMTMDALPAHHSMLAKLLQPFEDPKVACVYARQLPREDAGPVESYMRHFNYGDISRCKVLANKEELGIKTFFCSNVCAAYRSDVYLQLGGFEKRVIFNEDMIFAGKAIQAGYGVYYQAGARVVHSHNYSGKQQFRRYFDLGVSQEMHPEIFGDLSSEGEGMRLVMNTAKWLTAHGLIHLVPGMIWQSGCKYLGYRAGQKWRKLPGWLIRKCTSNPGYWEQQPAEGE